MVLSDKSIRSELINFLNNRAPAPNAIIEELRVHDGNAIADVVAVYKNAHCFEIKGENDTLNRILRQAEYYNTTFTKITLVTTENHLSTAEKLIPNYWGVLLAKSCGDKISFSYVRKAKHNTSISKALALSMLWKSELITIANDLNNVGLKKSITRAQLAEIIAENKSKEGIVSDITLSIYNRYRVKENS
jgi:hypothetical protein